MRGDRIRGRVSSDEAAFALEHLRGAEVNFTPPAPGVLAVDGWQIDDYCVALPSEPPGPPLPDGPWEKARRAAGDYVIADPSILRAAWRPEEPLEGRTMLLEGRFYWMRFLLGVRVSQVIDELREVDGNDVRVWGWSYQTLEGHLERGQMDYEVWKWISSGRVEFRMHAYSKPATITNPLVRVGFALFGRHMHKRFARRALDRMDRFVTRTDRAPVSEIVTALDGSRSRWRIGSRLPGCRASTHALDRGPGLFRPWIRRG